MREPALREVRPGDSVRAEDHNALVRAVLRLTALLSWTGPASEDIDDLHFLLGVVEEVQQPVDPDNRTISTVTYTCRPLRRSDDALLVEVRPLNPPTKDTTLVISPCEEGDRCLIVRWPKSDGTGHELKMIQLTETVDDGVCDEEGG